MRIDLLSEKLLQAIKKNKKRYEPKFFATNVIKGNIGIIITGQ